jgi:hypothetical protein
MPQSTETPQTDETGSPSEITIIGQASNTGSAAVKTTTISSATTSSALTSTAPTSSSASSASTSHASTPQSSNKGIAIGLGVGLSMGFIVAGLVAGLYFHGQRQGRKGVDYLTAPGTLGGGGKDTKGPISYYSPVAQVPPSELPQSPRSVPPSELSNPLEPPRSELPVDSSWATMNEPWASHQLH